MLQNPSGLMPLGRAVLVRMYEPEKKAGLIAIPDHVKERSQVMEDRAEVIAIGPEAWADEIKPRCAVGDKVIITRMVGYVARGTQDGQLYRLVNDRDIFCRILTEQNHGN